MSPVADDSYLLFLQEELGFSLTHATQLIQAMRWQTEAEEIQNESPAQAEALLGLAEEALRHVQQELPDATSIRSDLAEVLHARGVALELARLPGSIPLFKEAISLWIELDGPSSDLPLYSRQLVETLNCYGLVLAKTNLPAAATIMEAAIDRAESAIASDYVQYADVLDDECLLPTLWVELFESYQHLTYVESQIDPKLGEKRGWEALSRAQELMTKFPNNSMVVSCQRMALNALLPIVYERSEGESLELLRRWIVLSRDKAQEADEWIKFHESDIRAARSWCDSRGISFDEILADLD